MNVYIVSTGCYSDWSIVAICSSEEKAKDVMALYPKSDLNEIETWELDAHGNRPGQRIWQVRMNPEGETSWVEPCPHLHEDYISSPERCFHMFAKDKTHAVKIANERRIQLLAENKWDDRNA